MTAQGIAHILIGTLIDVSIVVADLFAFQWWLTRRPPPRLGARLAGLAHLFVGLVLFKIGLEISILPIGKELAEQLAGRVLTRTEGMFRGLLPLLAFATLLGFAATLIEPTLIAIGHQAEKLSGGAFNAFRFRVYVSFGVAIGLLLGTLRPLHGVPMELVVTVLVGVIALLSINAPRDVAPLAIDSGGMATSVVVVPLIAAFGVAVADTMPGRDPVRDGFGMIVLALLMPGIVLLTLAKVEARLAGWKRQAGPTERT